MTNRSATNTHRCGLFHMLKRTLKSIPYRLPSPEGERETGSVRTLYRTILVLIVCLPPWSMLGPCMLTATCAGECCAMQPPIKAVHARMTAATVSPFAALANKYLAKLSVTLPGRFMTTLRKPQNLDDVRTLVNKSAKFTSVGTSTGST